MRSFQEFSELNDLIESRVRVSWVPLPCRNVQHFPHSQGLPPFPDKHWKVFTDHLTEHFIVTRKTILENYVKKVDYAQIPSQLSAPSATGAGNPQAARQQALC